MDQTFEQEKRSFWSKTKSFFLKSKRVFRITKKPSREEFKVIVKVSAIGIAIIGAIGFLIHLVWTIFS